MIFIGYKIKIFLYYINKNFKTNSKSKKRSNSKTGGSRKQRGASDPNVVRQFNVYYNYILSNFKNEGGKNGDLLTRPLNEYELIVCNDYIYDSTEDMDQFKDLEFGVAKQLEEAHNGKHFIINFIVKNKTHEEATKLIHEFMEEIYAGGFIEFSKRHSEDPNRYYSSPGDEIDIENFVLGGYQKKKVYKKMFI